MPGINKCIGRMSVLLDYYPSAQFAGLHVANRMGLYKKRGLDLSLLPPPGTGGDEPQLVCDLQRSYDKQNHGCTAEVPRLAIGTVEQNVLIPALARGVQSKAFATIFQSSPLALGALPGTKLSSAADLRGKTIGMHVDSIELVHSLCSLSGLSANVVEVQRAQKVQDLIDGKVDAIQIYDCMEALELRHLLGGNAPNVLRLTNIASQAMISLGYSQVLFGAKWALRPPAARAALTAFLEASAEGWRQAQKDPSGAAAAILQDRAELKSSTGTEVDSKVFQQEALLRCLPYVMSSPDATADAAGSGALQTSQSELKILSINPHVWQQASIAMGITGFSAELVPECNSLDSTLYPPCPSPPRAAEARHNLVTDGKKVSEEMRQDAKVRASAFEMRVGRKPSLVILTVGAGHPQGEQRKSLFSHDDISWFNKEALCKAVGIEPLIIRLPETASFQAVHDTIQGLNRRTDVDAIILERPVPHSLDADVLGSYIAADKDVDGERRASEYADGAKHMAAQGIFQAAPHLELSQALEGSDETLARPLAPAWLSTPPAVLPCTVVGVLNLLHRSSLMNRVAEGLTVVVGRSPQLGAPLARELIKANATVVTCHSGTAPRQLASLCLMADTLLVCAGSPGLVTKEMVKKGALVVNCGTTFDATANKLLPDVCDDVAHVAKWLTPTPHGVGPTCAAALTLNTVTLAEAAARRRDFEKRHKDAALLLLPATDTSAIPEWKEETCGVSQSRFIRRVFWRASFRDAALLIADITVLAERANHHPTMHINAARTCEQQGGCEVVVELSTYTTKMVTEADIALALRVDLLA